MTSFGSTVHVPLHKHRAVNSSDVLYPSLHVNVTRPSLCVIGIGGISIPSCVGGEQAAICVMCGLIMQLYCSISHVVPCHMHAKL